MSQTSELKELLSRPASVVIVTHFKPDADALGSSLGLAGYLGQKGHTVNVITPSDFPEFLAWMPGCDQVLAVLAQDQGTQRRAEQLIGQAEIIFCLDFNGLGRIETLAEPVRESSAIKVMVDHHLEPENFTTFTVWDVRAASTAQLVYKLINDLGDADFVNPDVANCLYAGLMTDTGGFRHNNTHETEFRIAAELVARGANPNAVARNIYDTSSEHRLRLLGYVLCNKMVVLPQFRTAYMSLTAEELKHYHSRTGDTEGLVNYGLSVKDVCMSVFFYEREGKVRISLRSAGDFSVNDLARKHFNGGGHFNAAGGSSNEPLEATINRFVSLLSEYQEALQKA